MPEKDNKRDNAFYAPKAEAISWLSVHLSVYHVTYWQTATLKLSNLQPVLHSSRREDWRIPIDLVTRRNGLSVRILDQPFISDLTRSTAFGSCRSYCLLQSSTSMRMYLSFGEIGTILTSIYWNCSSSRTSCIFPPVFSRLDNL